jgi:methanogenic corrinoid protein MtbC1
LENSLIVRYKDMQHVEVPPKENGTYSEARVKPTFAGTDSRKKPYLCGYPVQTHEDDPGIGGEVVTSIRQQTREAGGKLSIGALSRSTGIPVETLRTWERRYGFPVPERKPSGHRVYPVTSVPRLRRIAEALARGHRASEAVAASEKDLTVLLDVTPVTTSVVSRVARREDPAIFALLKAVEAFDAEQLTRLLTADWRRLEVLAFLSTRIAPLIQAVGEEWAAARLGIHHEHFLSERVSDLLRSFRLPLEDRARGPLIILASLPGETHGLGLQMVALLLAAVGYRILYLGTEVPPAQIAGLAKDINAQAVAISVSIANRGEAMNAQLELLRGLLPKRVTLLVGGDGAPGKRPGLKVFSNLESLEAWGRSLIAAA